MVSISNMFWFETPPESWFHVHKNAPKQETKNVQKIDPLKMFTSILCPQEFSIQTIVHLAT